MKCYCYETESDFILCVEEVDERFHDVIQHAWFEKTDNKFLKVYPMKGIDNGVTAEDKELVKNNFARLGQSMFEGMLDCDWKSALLLFAEKCKDIGIEWYIFGSISEAVLGVDITPHDLDIFIHTRDFWKIKSIFSDFVIEPFVDNKGTWLVRYFGRLCLAGALFDICADEKMNVENHRYDRASWNNYDVYIEPLQIRYQLELKRNREDRIKAIETYMKNKVGAEKMKKIIPDVVNFPNGCETVRFTACFVSMLMRAEGITDKNCDFFCGKQKGNCIRCGQCADLIPINKKHEELYNLYTAVTGFGFLQIDLSNDDHMKDDWNQTCNVMLREFDWYIGFTMDYAGYDYEELIFPDNNKDVVFSKIKSSIDKDIPVLALFGRLYQWVLITGYDDDGALYGLNGSQGYWGKPIPEPTGYDENGLFIMSDWYEKAGHAFILGEKKEPTVTIQDVFKRGIKIMESMKEKRFYGNTVEYMLNDANFENLTDEELLKMRDRISAWIGQPIDQRAMLGSAMNPLRTSKEPNKEIVAFNEVNRLCWTMHDVLWIAWRGVGEYMGGDKLDWAKGLENKTIRRMIADCFAFVRDHDEYMLDELKKGG
jgi:hypothetical protein